MATPESTLIILLIILSLGLFIPELFRRLHLPFVTLLILAGAAFGPHGFDFIEQNEVIIFFGFLGMAFLMFMTGLETDITRLHNNKRKIITMAGMNGIIPFLVGIGIARYFGSDWITSLLIGTIFISSSVAIIVPALRSAKIFKKDIGQLILSAVLLTDLFSLILLGLILQSASPITRFPLPVYFFILMASIAALFIFVPKITRYVLHHRFSIEEGHEKRLRFVIIILIGALIYFSWLGVHPILASFLVGLMIGGALKKDKSDKLKNKFHILGYGLFVPVFFFIVGMQMDLSIFSSFDFSNFIMLTLIIGLIVSKVGSGFFAGKILKLTNKNSLTFGVISMTQLTTTLATTYAAFSLGLLNPLIVTSIITLSIITTFMGPLLVSFINRPKKTVTKT